MDTSGKALVDFWKWAAEKGVTNTNTANAKRAVCSQVLGALDGWQTVDVSTLDPEDVLNRFINKRSKDFTPASLATYRQRFALALREFLAYTKNPAMTWNKSTKKSLATKGKSTKPQVNKENHAATVARPTNGNGNGSGDAVVATPESYVGVVQPNRGGLDFQVPLRDGRFAHLRLPADLSVADAKRVAGVLHSLAIDSETN